MRQEVCRLCFGDNRHDEDTNAAEDSVRDFFGRSSITSGFMRYLSDDNGRKFVSTYAGLFFH